MKELPSYLEMLQSRSSTSGMVQSPRWWLAANFQPLAKTPDELAWQIRGQGVLVLTEDGYLNAAGQLVETGRASPLAEQWAEAMTDQYERLYATLPVFAQLRSCMDLAVVAALIHRHDLLGKAGCDLPHLTGGSLRGPIYNVPRSLESQARFSVPRVASRWCSTVIKAKP